MIILNVSPSFLNFSSPTLFFLLPCQWKYWHRARNRLRDKTGFGLYNPKKVEKSGFGQSVCVSVCLTVCLAVAFRASSHGRKG